MHGRRLVATVATALTAMTLVNAAAAHAAGPGETFPVATLPLPAGAIPGGESGFGGSSTERPAISRDGRYVAFMATADQLTPDTPVDGVSVYRKDRLTGAIELVSRADGVTGAPSLSVPFSVRISDDGNRVAWTTAAQLAPADVDSAGDVYVRDVAAGKTLLATDGLNGSFADFDLSGDGSWLVVASSARLAGGDTNAFDDVYRVPVAGGSPTLVSAKDGATGPGNATAKEPSISDDGRWVAFVSAATDLTGGALTPAHVWNVFVRDVANGRTSLVSTAAGDGARGANDDCSEPDVAGRPTTLGTVTVAYTCWATNLNAADTVDTQSVFLRNMGSATQLVSRADGVNGVGNDRNAFTATVSDDGRLVSFSSIAFNLGVAGADKAVYVRDVLAGRTASPTAAGGSSDVGVVSGDGATATWVEMHPQAPGADPMLVAVVAAPVTLPLAVGSQQLVGRPSGDAPFLAPAVNTGDRESGTRVTSADGRYVVFAAGDAHLPGGLVPQVYRKDTATGALELVSRANGAAGAAAPRPAGEGSVSADGNRIAFVTTAQLDPADGDADVDAYVRDVAAGTTTLVSRADGPAGPSADADADEPAITADGAHVVFRSKAGNLGTAGGDTHAYLRDLAAGRTVLVDRVGADGPAGDDNVYSASASADGGKVVFVSYATNLDPADPPSDTDRDAYVRDVAAGTTTLVSRRSGADGAKADDYTSNAVISADGRVVAFSNEDETLAPEAGGWGGTMQVVARDLTTRQNTLVSRAPGGAPANDDARDPALDGDGSVVAFESRATNLLPDRGGANRAAVFARDMATGTLAGPPAFGPVSDDFDFGALGASLSDDGQCLTFQARGHNAVATVTGDFPTLYLHVLSGQCPKPLPSTGGGGGGDGRPRAAVSAPVLSKVSLLRARFRVGRGATAVTAAAKAKTKKKTEKGRKKRKATPAGTAVRFTLSARANVTIAIERRAAGRKVGRQCRRATAKLRRKRRCTRWERVGALSRKGLDGGRRSVAFSGRMGRRALAPGAYRATVKAANAAGSSKPATLAFTVVRR